MLTLSNLITVLGFFTASSLASATPSYYNHSKELAKVAAEFKANGIVPDVLPEFNPSALAYLTFAYANGTSETISPPGLRIGRNDSQITPVISIKGISASSKKRYVGVVVDPDAPSRAEPTRRSIRHYLAPDLTIGKWSRFVEDANVLSNATFGTPAANDYRGPNPPAGSGPHRYIFFLYNQPANFDFSFLDLTNIAGFNLSSFAERTGLGKPLAGTYFQTEVALV